MKKIILHSLFATSVIISGCASMSYVTDSIVLTPDNTAAKKWGELSFYSQYKRGEKPRVMYIELPNGKTLKGQLLFPYDIRNTAQKDGFWDKVSVGFGVGVGSHSRSGGFGSIGIGTGNNQRIRKNNVEVRLTAFGDNIAFDCNGMFKKSSSTGTVTCEVTNGMRYRGVINRFYSK